MLVGLDFDNTIACYNDVFTSEAKIKGLVSKEWQGSKQDLKCLLNTLEDGQTKWQKIQGQVYGPKMQEATLFPGVARFLLRCKSKGYKVFIVSHKTKYGHFDKTKTPLREASLNWMDKQGFFNNNLFGIDKNNIFFANTQSEKVLKIKSLKLDVFVDDLEEIFLHPEFPEIKKILFSRISSIQTRVEICSNWTDIEKAIIGEIHESELKNILSTIYDDSIDSIKRIKGRGNSRVFKLISGKGNSFLLKEYPDLFLDPRPRMHTEVNALKLVENIGKTPKVVAFDKTMNIALYEWIPGESLYTIKDHHITKALNFIEKLQDLKGKSSFREASEACLSANNLISQVKLRLNKLLKIKNTDLSEFLTYTFDPLFKKISQNALLDWPRDNIEKELPRSKQVFSPSDFGFHNAIQKKSGELFFIDFEYFGLDDPVKLIADFIWHPGMKLNDSQKTYWINGAFSIFQNDSQLIDRFNSAWALYGLRWSLIVLNDFHKNGWHKRAYADENIVNEHKQKLAFQLIKAKNICKEIQITNMKCPYINNTHEGAN